jgi:hypothetical protein
MPVVQRFESTAKEAPILVPPDGAARVQVLLGRDDILYTCRSYEESSYCMNCAETIEYQNRKEFRIFRSSRVLWPAQAFLVCNVSNRLFHNFRLHIDTDRQGVPQSPGGHLFEKVFDIC